MTIVQAENDHHFLIIEHIALYTWPDTFKEILSEEQIQYMLAKTYKPEQLKSQVEDLKHNFILAYEDGVYHGFASYEVNIENSNTTKVHKLYVFPKSQGKGAGKLLLNHILDIAKGNNQKTIILNVNKYNYKAVDFYKNNNFQIIKEEDIDIGGGFVNEDYVMELNL